VYTVYVELWTGRGWPIVTISIDINVRVFTQGIAFGVLDNERYCMNKCMYVRFSVAACILRPCDWSQTAWSRRLCAERSVG